jgi:hypothetical protein
LTWAGSGQFDLEAEVPNPSCYGRRNRLVELGEQMAAAKPNAPADPLALMSAKS